LKSLHSSKRWIEEGAREKFGVTAAPHDEGAVSAAAAPAAVVEEKRNQCRIEERCAQKINVIKVVHAATGLGLKEAKDLVRWCAETVKESLSKDDAEKLKKNSKKQALPVELK